MTMDNIWPLVMKMDAKIEVIRQLPGGRSNKARLAVTDAAQTIRSVKEGLSNGTSSGFDAVMSRLNVPVSTKAKVGLFGPKKEVVDFLMLVEHFRCTLLEVLKPNANAIPADQITIADKSKLVKNLETIYRKTS